MVLEKVAYSIANVDMSDNNDIWHKGQSYVGIHKNDIVCTSLTDSI